MTTVLPAFYRHTLQHTSYHIRFAGFLFESRTFRTNHFLCFKCEYSINHRWLFVFFFILNPNEKMRSCKNEDISNADWSFPLEPKCVYHLMFGVVHSRLCRMHCRCQFQWFSYRSKLEQSINLVNIVEREILLPFTQTHHHQWKRFNLQDMKRKANEKTHIHTHTVRAPLKHMCWHSKCSIKIFCR